MNDFVDDLSVLRRCDAREGLELLEAGGIDLLLTDSPYASGARRSSERSVRGKRMSRASGPGALGWFATDSMTSVGFAYLLTSTLARVREKMVQGAHAYLFIDWRQEPMLIGAIESAGLRVNHVLVWDKTYFGMGAYYRNQHELIVFASADQPRALNRRDVPSVLRCKPVHANARTHPTEKPVGLLRTLIEVSTDPGEVVVDPFCGTGSTLVAARGVGRRSIGTDVDPNYLEVAKQHLESTRFPRVRVRKEAAR